MSDSQPWFTVRCLFSHPTRAKDSDGHLYEERVTLWKCGSWDKAYRQARLEAETYAEEADAILIDTTDAFHIFDSECGHGTEVWSSMRGSLLDPKTYIKTFCATDRDRMHNYTETFSAIQAMKTIFPDVDYVDASLDEIADFIRMRSREIRPPGIDIVLIPGSIGSRRLERLLLHDVSVASLMNYVAELTSTVVSYEEDAIVVRQKKHDNEQLHSADQPPAP